MLIASTPLEQLQNTELTYEDRLRLAASTGVETGPVSEPVWSATDWEVLAWLVERLHGKPLPEVIHMDVFEPVGMHASLVARPGQPPEPMLHGYALSGVGFGGAWRRFVAAICRRTRWGGASCLGWFLLRLVVVAAHAEGDYQGCGVRGRRNRVGKILDRIAPHLMVGGSLVGVHPGFGWPGIACPRSLPPR